MLAVVNQPDRIQLQLTLPYKREVGEAPRVRRHLDEGYRIVRVQRLTDREVLVTLKRGHSPLSASPPA